MSELYTIIECSECFCDIDDNCELNIWNTIKKSCKHFSINSNICYKSRS